MGSGIDLFGVRRKFPVFEENSKYLMVNVTKQGFDKSLNKGAIVVGDRNSTVDYIEVVSSFDNNNWGSPEAVSVYTAFSGVYDYFYSQHG